MHLSDDHSELLDLIEGDVDAQAAAALKAGLAQKPELLLTIEKMRRDRDELRALPEPRLPVDFSAQLETILARPMLIDSGEPVSAVRPGEFRRQHRKRTARIRWARLAIAAVVLLTASLAVWAVVSDWNLLRRSQDQVQVASSGGDINKRPVATPDQLPDDALVGIVHHYGPSEIPSVAHASRGTAAEIVQDVPASTESIQADFAIVLHGGDSSSAEDAIGTALSSTGEQVALVRNFSFAEAQRLTRELRLASGATDVSNAGNRDLAMASAHPTQRAAVDFRALAAQLRTAIKTVDAPGAANRDVRQPVASESGTLAGRAELGPSLEQQLEFSSRGAVLSVAMRADQLSRFVERLALTQGQSTSLRMLPTSHADADSEVVATNPMMDWLTEGTLARQSIAQIEHANGNAIVIVPVIVQPRGEPARR